MGLFLAPAQATRVTVYNGPTRRTASGYPACPGVAAMGPHVPFGTIVRVRFRNGRTLRRVVADRGVSGDHIDVFVRRPRPGLLPDYGRAAVESRGLAPSQWRHLRREARIAYLRRRLRSIGYD